VTASSPALEREALGDGLRQVQAGRREVEVGLHGVLGRAVDLLDAEAVRADDQRAVRDRPPRRGWRPATLQSATGPEFRACNWQNLLQVNKTEIMGQKISLPIYWG
jgi:hypothetical protein